MVLKRLILSGNPLVCICENLWIKLRLLEEPDGQDLTCTDDRGVSQAFITLTPPDCGMFNAGRTTREKSQGLPFTFGCIFQWFPKWWCLQTW